MQSLSNQLPKALSVLLLILAKDGLATSTAHHSIQAHQPTCLTDVLASLGFQPDVVETYHHLLTTQNIDIVQFRNRSPRQVAVLLQSYGLENTEHRRQIANCFSRNLDGCGHDPCQHGGECVYSGRSIEKYLCDCKPGYHGNRCQHDVCTHHKCQNGASCYFGVSGFECRCALGFTGRRCEERLSECDSNPCLNGGQCIDVQNNYTCRCLPDYEGRHCERRWIDVNTFQQLVEKVADLEALVQSQKAFSAQRRVDSLGAGVVDHRALRGQASAQSSCGVGIIGWKYVPWPGWRNGGHGRLRLEKYDKQHDNSILKITFSSVFMQMGHDRCAQWYLKVDDFNCSEPATIETIVHSYHGSMSVKSITAWRPAQLSGMCRATERGPLRRGPHAISVHVGNCPGYSRADPSTGSLSGVTSYLMVEEYCP